jgi:hypothetical protein
MEPHRQTQCKSSLPEKVDINQNLIGISYLLFTKISDSQLIVIELNLFDIMIVKFMWEENNIF